MCKVTDQLDGPAGQTSWTDQLDGPVCLYIVHCRSFRVRRRHCFIYFEIAIGQVVEDSCLYEDKDIPVPVISPPFTLSFRYLCTMHQCSSFDDASAVVHFVLGTDNTLQSKVQSRISQRRSTYCSILRFRIEQYFHL